MGSVIRLPSSVDRCAYDAVEHALFDADEAREAVFTPSPVELAIDLGLHRKPVGVDPVTGVWTYAMRRLGKAIDGRLVEFDAGEAT